MDAVVRFLGLLRTDDGVSERTQQILTTYRRNEAMSKDQKKSSSETDEPWKLPGQSSQEPEQKGPPKRNVDKDYAGDKAQTT